MSLALPLRIKKLRPDAVIPESKTAAAAGLDIVTLTSVLVSPGQTVLLESGIAAAIPDGYVGLMRPRSSAFLKKGVSIDGTIDADYRGELKVMLRNGTNETIDIKAGERYAQLVIVPAPSVWVSEVSELPTTERGTGGFGSTGV